MTLKSYVGSTVNIVGRCRSHRNSLRRNKHYSVRLQEDWNNLGEDHFEFMVLQFVDSKNREILAKAEQYWIDSYQTFDPNFGYNILPNAISRIGSKNTEISKERTRVTMNKLYEEGPKLREQLLAMNQKAMSDPETREICIKALTSESQTDAGRKRRSDLLKQMWKDGRMSATSGEMRRRYLCSKRAKALQQS